MSSNEPLFGFNTTQKLTLAEYIATHSGGGGSMVALSDVDIGVGSPLGVGDVLIVYSGEPGAFRWTNVPFGGTIQSNVDAAFAAKKLDFIDSSSPTAVEDLIADLIAKGLMDAS